MNGAASAGMREAGIEYKLNYGVGIPQLKQIASEIGKDPELAVSLWKEDIRECRILAALIYPDDQFMPDMADLWVEQIVFPEVAVSSVDNIHGLDVSIVTSTRNDAHAAELLKAFNFPFVS